MYDFSYQSYSRLLKEFLSRGYLTTGYAQFDRQNRGVLLLRHDIDISVLNCEKLWEIEAENGIHATWFFQPNNAFYNPLSSQCLSILSKLSQYHSLGLHIEPCFGNDSKDLERYINQMYNFYSNFLPLQKVVSFHRPNRYCKNLNIEIPGFINAYSNTFIKEMVYVSDSNRRCFWEQERFWEAIYNRRSVNMLIHPIWWAERSLQPEEILSKLEDVGQSMARNVLRNNVTCFAEMMKGDPPGQPEHCETS